MSIKTSTKNKTFNNYVIKTLTYNQLSSLLSHGFLEFNRVVSHQHVSKMIKSVEKCGILRFPVIGDVSFFDSRGLVIIDGQHLLTAILKTMSPTDTIEVIVKTYTNKRDVIQDIATLNNTNKSWNDKDYLEAWYNFGSENTKYYLNYEKLYDYSVGRFEAVSISLLVDIFTLNKTKFKEGELEFFDLPFSEELAEITRHLKSNYNKAAHTLTGLRVWAVGQRNSTGKVNFKKLRARLDQAILEKRDAQFSNSRDDFKVFLDKIYNEI